jgi:hypothetical protein
MNRLLRWGSVLFIVSTVAMLAWAKLDAQATISFPPWEGEVLIGTSVATLPFALARVFREADPPSRRRWALLLGLCTLLAAGVLLFWK